MKTISKTISAAIMLAVCPETSALADGVTAADVLRDSIPEHWVLDRQYFQTTPTDDRWWNAFNDPVLSGLLRRAVGNNFDVVAAQSRIEAARQVCIAARSGYYPTVGVSADWSHDRTVMTGASGRPTGDVSGYFSLGLTMNWEIDVFGRIAAQSKADKAAYEASVADYDATLVSLCANVAKAYFQLRLAQAELAVAEKTIGNSEALLDVAKTRYEVGLSPAVDVVQARMVVGETKATVPALKASVSTSINALALLIGEYPDSLADLNEPAPIPTVTAPDVSVSPSALLRRRPDVVEAEKELAEAAASVGIAKKDFLPTLSVSAEIGTQAHALKDLFGAGSLYYSVMPTLSWTIFDGFARKAKVAEARAQMEEEIAQYNQTVMTAVQEVNNAMISWQSVTEQAQYHEILLKDAHRILELQTDRYKQGLLDFTDVANAETTVLQYENAVVESKASQLAALVTLYAALGGGWE